MKVGKNVHQEVEELKKQVENLTMALRISQTLLQQVLPGVQTMGQEVKNLGAMLNDFQYRQLALQKVLAVDTTKLSDVASELKLVDWEKASDADDAERDLVAVDTVESPQDIIIFTSEVDGKEEGGIFRSKMVLAETGNQQMVEGLQGATVGATLSVELAGDTHNITILGIRRVKE
jgi:hypothetical protein